MRGIRDSVSMHEGTEFQSWLTKKSPPPQVSPEQKRRPATGAAEECIRSEGENLKRAKDSPAVVCQVHLSCWRSQKHLLCVQWLELGSQFAWYLNYSQLFVADSCADVLSCPSALIYFYESNEITPPMLMPRVYFQFLAQRSFIWWWFIILPLVEFSYASRAKVASRYSRSKQWRQAT